MTEPASPSDPPPPAADVVQRTSMAAERTWLAWWRTALAATVGSLAVGRLAPEVLDVAPWPYVVLGVGYAGLAVGLLVMGAVRQRNLERAIDRGSQAPLSFQLVTLFTVGGVLLALTIGMTFQVSDTDLTGKRIRRNALHHALLSYVFGAVILAITVNSVAGLLGR